MSKVPFLESPAMGHLTHGAEIAGLATLGLSSARKLKRVNRAETSPQERSDAKKEIAGLGILAVPSAIHLGHSVYKKFRGK